MSTYVIAAPVAFAEAAEDLSGIAEAIKGAAAGAANAAPLQTLEQRAESLGLFAPVERLLGHPLFGNATGAGGPGQPTSLLGTTPTGGVVTSAVTAPATNGVTGVKTGFSLLQIPLGTASIFGIPLGPLSLPAPAHWYFPTQADGSVHANGVIYLQHG